MKAVNLAIHIACCCLLVPFLKAMEFDSKTVTFASLIFSTHPLHVEAVSGIVSRCDLMACFIFLVCGILFFNVFYKGKEKSPVARSLTMFILTLLASVGILIKESAITILVSYTEIAPKITPKTRIASFSSPFSQQSRPSTWSDRNHRKQYSNESP